MNVFSFNGRPGTRQGSRTPHRGAVWPVDAYSLAVTCGGRGVSLDIWPASHSAPAAPRAVRLSGHDRDRSPSRTTRRATTWFPPRRVLPGRRGVPPAPWRPPWPSVVRFPPARYHEDGVPVPMRCVDRLCCCVAARHWRSFSLPLSHAGLFVPATSPVATGVCGAPYHRVITRAPAIFLAKPLARLAARPLWRPVTTGPPHPATCHRRRYRPLPAAGTVVTGSRLRPPAPAESGPNSRRSP